MIAPFVTRQQYHLLFSSVAFLLFLQGCTSSQTIVAQNKIDSWSLKGKMGLIYPDPACHGEDCHMKNNQGGIAWQQNGNRYRIAIKDPFGRKVMVVSGDANHLVAKSPNEAPRRATPDHFVNQLIGVRSHNNTLSDLSLNDLKYWITGRANPQWPVVKQRDNFSQKGFVVTAKYWRTTDVGRVPSLIIIKKKRFTLKVVIKGWEKIAT